MQVVNLIDILSDRWSMIVIRDLFFGKKKFKDFMSSNEKISTSVLTSRLKLLCKKKIIDNEVSIDDSKIKHYFLTDKGIDLYPIIFEMSSWSLRNYSQKFENTVRYNSINVDEFILNKIRHKRKTLSKNSYILYRQKLAIKFRKDILANAG